jgi:hypothetical protein
MRIIAWIHVVLGLLAIGSGAIVLRGVLGFSVSGHRVARFLECSLLASLVGLLPLTRHLLPIQGICILSVYFAGVVVLAWRKFHLDGLWLSVFAFSIVAVLYLNVVSVSIRLFTCSAQFEMVSTKYGPLFGIAQFAFASVFAVLAVMAVRKCHTQQTHSF